MKPVVVIGVAAAVVGWGVSLLANDYVPMLIWTNILLGWLIYDRVAKN